MLGASHITIEILKHRDKFEASFGNAWRKAESDVKYALRGEGAIVDRIQGNWTVLLATYIALEDVLQLPYTYADLLELSTRGILRQNEMSASVDEVAGFWNIISSAIQKGILIKDQDYKIRYKRKLRTSKQKEEMDFEKNIPILMIRKNVMLSTYREQGRRMDEQVLPQESMLHYLEITPEYYGYTTSPERFKKFNANGIAEREEITDEKGNIAGFRTVWSRTDPCASTMSWLVRNMVSSLTPIQEVKTMFRHVRSRNRQNCSDRKITMHPSSQILIGLFVLAGAVAVRQPPFSCAVRARIGLYRPQKMVLRTEKVGVAFVATCSNFVKV